MNTSELVVEITPEKILGPYPNFFQVLFQLLVK